MTTTTQLNISPSLMREVLPVDACGQYLKYRFIDKEPTEPTELMIKGRLFEYLLTGYNNDRDGVPELPKLKRGGMSQGEKDLNELVTYANIVCESIGLDVKAAEKGVVLHHGDEKGIIDLLGNDIQKPERKAIYDIKYAETKFDDRWNGWADFDNRLNEKVQARHYISLYQKINGSYLPYYFLIFGKSFWCRIIKVVVTLESIAVHERTMTLTRERIARFEEAGWKANPEFMKCAQCPYSGICKSVSSTPTIEYFEI